MPPAPRGAPAPQAGQSGRASWGSLRVRVAAAMAALFLLTAGLGALMRHGTPPPAGVDEPYQDTLVLAGFTLPALILIWAVVGWSLRPLSRASEEAARIGPGHIDARLPRAGVPADILPLVDAVNGALDRMAGAFAAERRFTENAAHELRTPLAVLSLRLQRARDSGTPPDWPAIDADMAQLTRLVGQMMDLARKEHAGRAPPLALADPARLAREAAAQILPLAEARGRALDLRACPVPGIAVAADDVRDALVNLLENAVLHGAGAITLTVSAEDGGVAFIVADTGAGPPAALRHALFDRFARHGAAPGSGLGLAIVREVARTHGGRVGFLPGPACRVSLWLPRGQAAA